MNKTKEKTPLWMQAPEWLWMALLIVIAILCLLAVAGATPDIVVDPSSINRTIYSDESFTGFINIINYGENYTDVNGTTFYAAAKNLTFTLFPGIMFNPLVTDSLGGYGNEILIQYNYTPVSAEQYGVFHYVSTVQFTYQEYSESENTTYVRTNSSLYKQIEFNITQNLHQTTVAVAPLQTSFNISWNETKATALSVGNTGGYPAYNVTLAMPGTVFSSNVFDLLSQEDEVLYANISCPSEVQGTANTNKTYYKTLSVSGVNFPTITVNYTIFVPFRNFTGNETAPVNDSFNYSNFWRDMLEYCRKFPASPYCTTAQEVIYQNQTVYVPQPHMVNVSDADMKTFIESLDLVQAHIRGIDADMSNIKSDTAGKYMELGEILINITDIINYTKNLAESTRQDQIDKDMAVKLEAAKQEEEAKVAENQATVMKIGLVLLLLFVMTIIGCVYAYWHFKKKNTGVDSET